MFDSMPKLRDMLSQMEREWETGMKVREAGLTAQQLVLDAREKSLVEREKLLEAKLATAA